MRLLTIAIAAIFALSCVNRGAKQGVTDSNITFNGNTIEISDSLLLSTAGVCDTLDLGRIREGEVVQNSIKLHNIGNAPLVILSVESSCGCATVDYPSSPIAGGSEAFLSLQFDSRGFGGWQFKLIKLRTSLCDTPIRIYLSAEVE